MDEANGGYYSPLHEGGCASILPVPEKNSLRHIPSFMNPDNIVDPCGYGVLSRYYVCDCFSNNVKAVHNDPRPDLGFYTGHYAPYGRIPKSFGKRLREGDILLFMAGLAEYPEDLWDHCRTVKDVRKVLSSLKRRGKAGIYIVSGLVVERVVDIGRTGWVKALRDYPVLEYSPHYYSWDDRTVAVIGKGFIISPPLKIYCFREGLSREFIDLVGRDNAVKIMRNNFRRSGVVEVSYRRVRDIVYLST